ncbi:MAG: penicillin-binding protein 2 [Candidatus Aminicenantes bacterium]|nr:penicillin-binding protein 2 [Candidatus Aminicenantes bacterium]
MNGPAFPPGEESVRKTARIRTRIVLIAMILWASGIVIRLVHLQIFYHDRAKDQIAFQNQAKVKIFPDRGTIRDRRGTILAQMISQRSVFYAPSSKESLDARLAPLQKLIPLLELDEKTVASIQASVEQKKPFIWIKRKINLETAARVDDLLLPGIFTQEEPRRIYPQGSLAAHVLGGVNIDNGGQAGVEILFNETLLGKPGERIFYRDTYKRPYRSEQTVAPERGRDIDLTIDAVIQYIAQREIEKSVVENKAAWGAVIVSDPSTGEILAMASAPSYDPNQYGNADRVARMEWAYSRRIDPGSTFKIVTAAAALENRRVATYETFDCRPESIDVVGGPIRDHKPFGILSFSEIIAESSNIGTIQIGRRVGAELLYKTIKDFGFGERTGIELPSEAAGVVHPPDEWSRRSLDSISVGYEVSVTPLQLLQAVNIVANRGVRLVPRIIKSVAGRPRQPQAGDSPPVQVISAQTAEKLIDILERVVLEGTGTAAALKGYAVAGKTGTSQIYDPVDRKYSLSRHTASFIGFVPSDKPALSMVVVLYEPKNSAYYGGQVAAPVFREIALRVLRYLHVFPSPTNQTILASAARREAQP